MKKLQISVIAAMVVSLVALPSQALDQRITLSVSKELALSGTFVTLSSGQSVGERTSYDWSNFKYEIHQENPEPSLIRGEILQSASAACPGQFSLESNSLRTCQFEQTSSRFIVGAPGVGQPGNALKITSTTGTSTTLRIRSWLDIDGDNRVSAFEPTSLWKVLEFVSVESAKPFVNFSVTPPLLVNRGMEAFVGDGGNPQLGTGLLSLTDIQNLKVRLVSCDGFGCESLIVPGSFTAHPQFGTYRFTGQRTNWDTGRYRFELIYSSGLVDDYVLAAQEFDYTLRSAISIDTSISTSSNAQYTGPSLNLFGHWQKAKSLSLSENQFTYSATVKGPDGKPVQGVEVYLYVDLKEVANQTAVKADGVKLQAQSRDEVIITKVTDAFGRVDVLFENPNPKDRDQISINLSTQGLMVTEYQGAGGREFAIWERSRQAILALSGGKASGGNAVVLTATLLGESGPVQGQSIGFSAAFPLSLERTAAKTDGQGKLTNSLRLSHMATGSGSQQVTVFTVYNSKLVSSSYLAKWDTVGATLELIPVVEEVQKGYSWSYSAPIEVKPGATLRFSPILLDASGRPVTSSALTGVVASYEGPGLLLSQPASTTDSKGRVTVTILAGSQDSGLGKLTLTMFDADSGGLLVQTFDIRVGLPAAKVSVGTFNSKVVVYAKGVKGSRLSVKVAGKWYSKTLSGGLDSITVRSQPGFTIAISSYLDGVFLRSQSIVTK